MTNYIATMIRIEIILIAWRCSMLSILLNQKFSFNVHTILLSFLGYFSIIDYEHSRSLVDRVRKTTPKNVNQNNVPLPRKLYIQRSLNWVLFLPLYRFYLTPYQYIGIYTVHSCQILLWYSDTPICNKRTWIYQFNVRLWV